jgi:8-amino-7-oxononanoate synthase
MISENIPSSLASIQAELAQLTATSNLRHLPEGRHIGRDIEVDGHRMLNLSSNDYLGLTAERGLREEFLATLTPDTFMPTSSSSRLLTGNFDVYTRLENRLTSLFGKEAALVFNSGYHMNTGILPAVSDAHTLILADKLVHASLIDGIRLSPAKCIRFRHNRYDQLEQLLQTHARDFDRVIVVVESIYSMDGDVADLHRLVALKREYPQVLIYVDEAHGIGVRGPHGLGIAEEQGVIEDIDFLCGTFGKALASVGGYIVCSRLVRDYLVNKMRTLIFTTALPPVCLEWTLFILNRLEEMQTRRQHLALLASMLKEALVARGYDCPSESHIVPMTIGPSAEAMLKAEELQRKGFYVLPVRPPTVPEGTSRLRFSLTAAVTTEEVEKLIQSLEFRA